jgi:hypothetical protein
MAMGLLLAVMPAAASFGQEPRELSLQGHIAHPHRFSLSELEAMPAVTVSTDYAATHGLRQASYTGALLWTLLDRAGLIDASGTKTHLQHVILARGSDGYAVVLALGELDPAIEGKPVIIAYEQDGKPIGGLRLIVPDDKRPARAVKNLVTIEAE